MSTISCVNCGNCAASQLSIFWNSGNTGRLKFWCGACPRKCRVQSCTTCKPDQTHYCNVCTQDDVTHRSSECRLHQPTMVLMPQQIGYRSQQVVFAPPQVVFSSPQVVFGPPQVVFAPPQVVFASPHSVFQQQPTPPPARMILGSPTSNGVAFRPMTTEDMIMSRGQFGAPGLQGVIDAQRRLDAQTYQGGNIRWAPTNFSPQGGFPF